MKYETFQQKLDRFKREPIRFLVKSKEIADELAKVFEREGMKGESGKLAEDIMDRCELECRSLPGSPWVSYNFTPNRHRLSFGNVGISGGHLEFLDITLEELKSYNAPQTLEDKLALFKAGTHVLHTPTQEIYDKLMIELEKRGYVWHNGESMTKYSFTFTGGERGDLCIQYNSYKDHKVTCGCIKYCKQKGLEILTLTPEDFGTPQVITITSDGYHRVTAESNGITAEALCNPTDKFSIHKGSHMALKRLLEKLEEEPEVILAEPESFHVGDIVEVVECDFTFANEVKGVQGIITKDYGGTYDVKFPVNFTNRDTWDFYGSELKLVRKYNA